MLIKFQKILPLANLPHKAHDTDAGYDLCSAENITILPGGRSAVRLGFAAEIPAGYGGFILPRSGLALKKGITVLNAPGLIDHGYTGEWKVILYNTGIDPFDVIVGERIAQLVVQKVESLEFDVVDVLDESERADGGFGSTGVSLFPEMAV